MDIKMVWMLAKAYGIEWCDFAHEVARVKEDGGNLHAAVMVMAECVTDARRYGTGSSLLTLRERAMERQRDGRHFVAMRDEARGLGVPMAEFHADPHGSLRAARRRAVAATQAKIDALRAGVRA